MVILFLKLVLFRTSIRLNSKINNCEERGANFYLLIGKTEPENHYFELTLKIVPVTLGSLKKFKVPSLIDPNAQRKNFKAFKMVGGVLNGSVPFQSTRMVGFTTQIWDGLCGGR